MKNIRKEVRLIEEKIFHLANNTSINGEIWRAIYTEEDRIAKKIVSEWMEEHGLNVYQDSVGNIFGRIEGKSKDVVLVGSHIDTVKNGGLYDGALGIITAIIAVKELLEIYGQPKKSIEVVALAEEEGSRFGSSYIGSKAITGKLTDKELYEKDEKGITLYEAMRKAGYIPEDYRKSIRIDLSSFIELHIEQGPVLENESIDIGIAKSIVGIISYEVSIKGMQNHAGTTPMNMRKDPVLIVAKLIEELSREVLGISNTATLTFGKINASPGVANVIAEKVSFSVDIRDGVNGKLIDINSNFMGKLKHIEQLDYNVSFERQCYEMPISIDTKMVEIIEKSAQDNNKTFKRMNSGAGHDAQIFADVVPTGLIFIPSKNGISHSPDEYSFPEGLEAGLVVLMSTIKKLAWE